eukprot:g2646.t1
MDTSSSRNLANEKQENRKSSKKEAKSVDHVLTSGSSDSDLIMGDEIRSIMYGFGDAKNPREDSTKMLESIALECIEGITKDALKIAHLRGKLDWPCFTFPLRKDTIKYNRIKELLELDKDFRAYTQMNFKDIADEKT